MKLVYPNTLSTFSGDKALGLEVGYLEVSDEDYADLVETKKKWSNGQIVDDETYAQRKLRKILLKRKKTLNSLDDHTLEHVEGQINSEEYDGIKQQNLSLDQNSKLNLSEVI